MQEKLFRKKSLQKVSSPEQLNDYIRASNPGIWLLLSAIILLLVGAIIWGIFGKLDTLIPTGAVSKKGEIICYVKEKDLSRIQKNTVLRIQGKDYPVVKVERKPVSASSLPDSYILHAAKMSESEWAYPVICQGSLEDGVYPASLIVESVSPISFLTN